MRARSTAFRSLAMCLLSACAGSATDPEDAGTAASDAAPVAADVSLSPEPDAAAGLDAADPERDASAPAHDASRPPVDAGQQAPDGSDLAAPDAAAPGPDAAAPPGLDAATPDAGPVCEPACAAGQACLETACFEVGFASLCAPGRATVLTDGMPADDAAASAIGAALQARCGAGLAMESASLGLPAVFDAACGRLLTARTAVAITGGGFFYNPLVGALEDARRSPLYFTSQPPSIGWAASATGAPVFLFPSAGVTATHDYFVVELFPDGDGRLVIVDYGIGTAGTQAAGRQAAAMLADPQGYLDRWYVYEWLLDADAGADSVRLVVSGQ